MQRPIFHLSFPVRDLAAAKTFYCDFLGASIGRDNDQWTDILLFGHQLTLHHRPNEVLPPELRGVRHFGVILPWHDWEALGTRLQQKGFDFVRPPTISDAGTMEEYGKMLFCDPSDNLIEIKAYKNAAFFGARHVLAGA